MIAPRERKNVKMKKENIKSVGADAPVRPTSKARKSNGITLISLVITIVLMLILASITVNVVINGGLFEQAGNAKKNTEIASEKETLTQATILAVAEDKRGNLSQESLQNKLDKLAGEEKTKVYDTGEEFEVLFKDSGLYYEVDKKGNIGDYKTGVNDKNPANIYTDENGNTLDGVEKPYQINCIEDLVMIANAANGAGNYIDENGNIAEISSSNTFSGKNFELMRTLNFNSPTSYADLSIKWSYDAENDAYIIDENSTTNLMEIIINKDGVGFVPIGAGNSFAGNFDGKCHEIRNIYENRTGDACLFGGATKSATIKNIGLTGELISGTFAASFGKNWGGVYNCYSSVKITATNEGAGIVGFLASGNRKYDKLLLQW